MKEQRIMKKIIALLMAVLMTAGMLAACSSTPAEGASPTVENTKAQAETAVVSGEKEKALEYWRQAEKLANEPPQEGSEPRDEKELKLLKKKIAQKKYFAE